MMEVKYPLKPSGGDALSVVVEALRDHPGFAHEIASEEAFLERIVTPHRLGHLRSGTLGGKPIFYTWTKLEGAPLSYTPQTVWRNDEAGRLWIVDAVWSADIPARYAVDAMSEDVLSEGLIKDGEIVLFYRGAHGRYGWVKVKEGRRGNE